MPVQPPPRMKPTAELHILNREIRYQADEPLLSSDELAHSTEVILDVGEDIEWAERSNTDLTQYR